MIKVYGRDNCKFCTMAKELLEEEGLEHTYAELVHYPMVREMAKERGQKTLPVIIIDNELIGGYDELKDYLASEVMEEALQGN